MTDKEEVCRTCGEVVNPPHCWMITGGSDTETEYECAECNYRNRDDGFRRENQRVANECGRPIKDGTGETFYPEAVEP